MKILIALAALFLTAVPKECAMEEEETEVTNLPRETGYTAEDTQLRKAYADWVEFCKEADSIMRKGKEEFRNLSWKSTTTKITVKYK